MSSGATDSIAATALFVEVLVIGVGALVAFAVAAAVLIGPAPVREALSEAGATGALLVTAAAYAMGIVVDRAADAVFQPAAGRLLSKSFQDRRAYERARQIVHAVPNLSARSAYSRSRLRVCRGWALNVGALIVLLQIYALVRGDTMPDNALLAGWVLGGAALLGLILTWRSLARNGYQQLALQAAALTPPADQPMSP